MSVFQIDQNLGGKTYNEVIEQFSRYTTAVLASEDSWSSWVFSEFLKAQALDPGKPQTILKHIRGIFEGMEAHIQHEDRGELRMKSFKLTGPNPLSRAYRKCVSGLEKGLVLGEGDLTSCGKVADAVSKLNAADKKAEGEAKAVQALKDLITEETGHAEGSAEHTAEFDKRRLNAANDPAPPSSTVVSGDYIAQLAASLEAEMRVLSEGGFTEAQIKGRVDTTLGLWKKAMSDLVKKLAKNRKAA